MDRRITAVDLVHFTLINVHAHDLVSFFCEADAGYQAHVTTPMTDIFICFAVFLKFVCLPILGVLIVLIPGQRATQTFFQGNLGIKP